MKKHKGYKYRLHELLRKLSVEDYETVWKWAPVRLGITRDTFKKWIYIQYDDKWEIPGKAVIMLSQFFEIEPHELFNVAIPELTQTEMKKFAQAEN